MFLESKGKITPQAHVGLPAGTYEEEFGRRGFFGRVSHLYHANPPVNWLRVEGPLKPRAIDSNRIQPADATDPHGGPTAMLYNDDLRVLVSRRSEPMPYYYRNADGDETWFVHRGSGRLETIFGPLDFEPGDYVVIPRGTTYRLVPKTKDNFFLIIESRGEIGLPDRGMLGRHAQFDPALLQSPEPSPIQDNREWELRIKRLGEYTSVFYPFNPIDVVGWKGDLSVVKINVRDIKPIVSPGYHLPPSVHTTFVAHNFVICSFLPRPLESDPKAMKVPFYHSNIDFDEVIFYHAGDFFSRHGIGPGMLTLHPQGIHHGPHPKAIEASKNKTFTDEIAVMIDARNPLHVAEEAIAAEWAEYHMSWSEAGVAK